jgi:hypothetical protein
MEIFLKVLKFHRLLLNLDEKADKVNLKDKLSWTVIEILPVS